MTDLQLLPLMLAALDTELVPASNREYWRDGLGLRNSLAPMIELMQWYSNIADHHLVNTPHGLRTAAHVLRPIAQRILDAIRTAAPEWYDAKVKELEVQHTQVRGIT